MIQIIRYGRNKDKAILRIPVSELENHWTKWDKTCLQFNIRDDGTLGNYNSVVYLENDSNELSRNFLTYKLSRKMMKIAKDKCHRIGIKWLKEHYGQVAISELNLL